MSNFSMTMDGEGAGHQFRGNQYEAGQGGGWHGTEGNAAAEAALLHAANVRITELLEAPVAGSRTTRYPKYNQQQKKDFARGFLHAVNQGEAPVKEKMVGIAQKYFDAMHEGWSQGRAWLRPTGMTTDAVPFIEYPLNKWEMRRQYENGFAELFPNPDYPKLANDGEAAGHQFRGNQWTKVVGAAHETSKKAVTTAEHMAAALVHNAISETLFRAHKAGESLTAVEIEQHRVSAALTIQHNKEVLDRVSPAIAHKLEKEQGFPKNTVVFDHEVPFNSGYQPASKDTSGWHIPPGLNRDGTMRTHSIICQMNSVKSKYAYESLQELKDSVRETILHEMGHAKYAAAYDGDPQVIAHLSANMREIMTTGLHVSTYSAYHWEQFAKNSGTPHYLRTAINETFAEINAGHSHGKLPAAWVGLAKLVNEHHDAVNVHHEKKRKTTNSIFANFSAAGGFDHSITSDGESAGHAFRGNQYTGGKGGEKKQGAPSGVQAGWLNSPGGRKEEEAAQLYMAGGRLLANGTTREELTEGVRLLMEAHKTYSEAHELYTAQGDHGPAKFTIEMQERIDKTADGNHWAELSSRQGALVNLENARSHARSLTDNADDYSKKADAENSVGGHNRAMEMHNRALKAWQDVRTMEAGPHGVGQLSDEAKRGLRRHENLAENHKYAAYKVEDDRRHAEQEVLRKELEHLPDMVGKKQLFVKAGMTDAQISHVEAHNAVIRIGAHAGINPERINLSKVPYDFKVDGKQHTAGGSVNAQSAQHLSDMRIKVYPQAMKGASEKNWVNLLAHESGHVIYEQAVRNYKSDYEGVVNRPDLKMGSYGNLTSHKDQSTYAAYHHMQEIFSTKAKTLAEEDGVTEYSREYWRGHAKGENTRESAMHETFSEIHALVTAHAYEQAQSGGHVAFSFSKNGIKPTWEKYYGAIIKLAGKKGYAHDGEGAGHAFRGNQYTKRTPQDIVNNGHTMAKAEYAAHVASIELLPREVKYYDGAEVIRNPTSGDLRTLAKEMRSDNRHDSRYHGPRIRSTHDEAGNTWSWRADKGLHEWIEYKIAGKEDHSLSQYNSIPDHESLVRRAIREHLPVPAHVQAEYPHLTDYFKGGKSAYDGEAAGHKFRGNQYKHLGTKMVDPQSPEFKAWFGSSTTVNDAGEPRVVYHGTSKDKDFTSFNVGQRGAWFTKKPEEASAYAEHNDSQSSPYNPQTRQWEPKNNHPRVFPVFLKTEKPYVMTDKDIEDHKYAKSYVGFQRDFFARVRHKGFDSVVFRDGTTIVFRTDQIKSATANTGKFSHPKNIFDAAFTMTTEEV